MRPTPEECKRISQEWVAEVLKDPRLNRELVHPDTPILKSRLLSNMTILGNYRPDLFHEYWYKRPSEEDIKSAIYECCKGLTHDVLWRTAFTEGVFYRNKNEETLADHICLVICSRLTKDDAQEIMRK